MVLGQVATFSRTNRNIAVSCKNFTRGRQSVGKVLSIAILMVINERFAVNMRYVHYSVCTVFQ